MTKVFLIISLMVFPLTTYAGGEDYDYGGSDYGYFWKKLDHRLERQHESIKSGIVNGSLNHREVKVLQRQQHRIRKHIDRLRYRYRLSHYDRRRILHDLDKISENIYRLKHNGYYAYNRYH